MLLFEEQMKVISVSSASCQSNRTPLGREGGRQGECHFGEKSLKH